MIKTKKTGPEVEFVRVSLEGGVRVEDARGTRTEGKGDGDAGEEDGEDGIWWVWEEGVVEGWRER